MCSLFRKYPKASLPKKQVFILNSLLNLLICVFDTCWTFMKTRWGLLTQSSSGWCASAIGQLWRLTYIQWWQMAMCKMFWNNVSQRCMEVTMGVHHTAQCLRAMQLKGDMIGWKKGGGKLLFVSPHSQNPGGLQRNAWMEQDLSQANFFT